jgi:tRNA(fMet)-specific endonuclease VapC
VPLRYSLDTNILSDLIRHPQGNIANKIHAVGESSVCTSIIVAAELRFGAAKSGSSRLTDRVDIALSALEVLPSDSPADRHYADIRQQLTRRGEIIGPNDLLIAAHARSQDLIMITANTREFSRVPQLGVENWLDG